MAGTKRYWTDHEDPVVRELELIRERLGHSQQAMADAIGVPFRTYQKWVYSAQSPRHGAALLSRGRALIMTRRTNCWEMLECGREPGGDKVNSHGPCPAAVDDAADGVNSGLNGGRVCWAISGTFCGAPARGTVASKLVSCFSCNVFARVLQDEGLANFKLLMPGQIYEQT
jgi:hypothetical protein